MQEAVPRITPASVWAIVSVGEVGADCRCTARFREAEVEDLHHAVELDLHIIGLKIAVKIPFS
jgi:hypothetical protein